jgi:hypothetical protein
VLSTTALAAGTSAAQASPAPEQSPEQSPEQTPGAGQDEGAESDEEAGPDATPLEVVIERLTPSTLPDRDQQVVVSGRVTNTDDGPWSELAVYLLTSAEPITSAAELDEAVASDPALEIGERIVTPGLFQNVPDLEPGESARFRLEVPGRSLLASRAPGVYWLSVHVLGTNVDGRIEGADGRARTFLPHVPDVEAEADLALGVQVRRHVVRASDGTLEFDQVWRRQLRGRLDRLVRLARSARTGSNAWSLTWLVDGAVTDAARSLAAGDPTVDLVASGAEVTGPAEEPSDEEAAAEEATNDPTARLAERWLARLTAAAQPVDVLALPYGDLDVSAVAGDDTGDLLEIAFDQAEAALSEIELASQPVVAPPDGYLAPDALAALGPDLRVVLGEQALPPDDSGDTDQPRVLAAPRGGSLTTAPPVEGVWGPEPGPVGSALAVRQRLLADAALHALSDQDDQPLVALLPPMWEPGKAWRAARFFDGLDVPWLSPVSLAGLLDPSVVGSEVARADELAYPDEQAEAEVPAYAVAATEQLLELTRTLEDLLTDSDSPTGQQLERQALLTSSYWSRAFPGVATQRARDAALRVDDWLGRVSIRGPEFVTMSSERGSIQVTIVNGLDQPVTVGLAADASGAPLTLTLPDPVDLPPGGRQAMDIEADVLDIGVHQVTLQPVSETGRPLGEVATLSVRSSQVGLILWFIMAGGAVTLFGAITVRTVRRVRAASRRRRAAA